MAQRIKLMTIWFGTNDSVLEGESQHVPLDKYKANLSHLVSLVRSPMSPYQDPQTRIVLITCPPVMEKAWTAHLAKVRLERGESDVNKPSRSKENARLYAQACKDVAEQEELPVVDAYAEVIRAAGGDSEDQLAPFFT
jgi:lysophospholipase L1-like esterase